MKKYIVKQKWNGVIFGEYLSKKEASDKLMGYIHYFNKEYEGELSPFDYELEEVEMSVADLIPEFESARRYLNLKGSNEKNIQALIALDQLFTIAEAWNKEDGFVPDFSDFSQDKCFPWFKYDKDAAEFVFAHTDITRSYGTACIGSRLCFKTEERAEQFGKQFAELFNKVFLMEEKEK